MKISWLLGAGVSKQAEYPLVSDFLCQDYYEGLCQRWQAAGMARLVEDRIGKDFRYFSSQGSDLNFLMSGYLQKGNMAIVDRLNTYVYNLLRLVQWFHADYPAIPYMTAFAEYLGSSNSTVISFNYDMLVEEQLGLAQSSAETFFNTAYDTSKPPYNMGIVKSRYTNDTPAHKYWLPASGSGYVSNTIEPTGRVTIYKLHGSIGWFYCSNCGILIYNPPRDNRFKYLHIEGWPLNIEVECWGCGLKKAPIHCLFVPPACDRFFPAWKVLDELWEGAEEEICSSDILVIAGYSLPKEDERAREMLSRIRNRHSELKILLVDPCLFTSDGANYHAVLGDFLPYAGTFGRFIGTLCAQRTESLAVSSSSISPTTLKVLREMASENCRRIGTQFPMTNPLGVKLDHLLVKRSLSEHSLRTAATAVGVIPTEDATEFLVSLACHTKDPLVRSILVNSITGSYTQAAVDKLIQFAYDGDVWQLPAQSGMPLMVTVAGGLVGMLFSMMSCSPDLNYIRWQTVLSSFAHNQLAFPWERIKAQACLDLGNLLGCFRE